MDMYHVQADEFIKHCIQQRHQGNSNDTNTIESDIPDLLEEDQESDQGYRYGNKVNRIIQEHSITSEYSEPYQDNNIAYTSDEDTISEIYYINFSDHSKSTSLLHASSSLYDSKSEQNTVGPLSSSVNSISQQIEDEYQSISSGLSEESYQQDAEEEENIPKTFLALKGISIANFNMGCNFQVFVTLQIKVKYEIYILAIQEHTPWNKELYQFEIDHIQRICEKYGYFAVISKMQILIFDKQLSPCYQETKTYLHGRLLCSTFNIAANTMVNFVVIYGYPHSPKNRNNPALKKVACESHYP
jgi:hypothetical protein